MLDTGTLFLPDIVQCSHSTEGLTFWKAKAYDYFKHESDFVVATQQNTVKTYTVSQKDEQLSLLFEKYRTLLITTHINLPWFPSKCRYKCSWKSTPVSQKWFM